MLKKLALCALLLTPCAAAQDLSAEEVLTRLEERSASLQDAYFLLTGTVYDSDTQEYALEVDVQFIPGEELARADIYQPDALADNFIVADGDTVYNYLFVTNQVTILSADDPEALGDLLPEGQGTVNLTPDLGRFFQSDKWLPASLSFIQTDGSPLAELSFSDYELDTGLDPAALREIPADAERIDER
jgi:outer membrane lipoprotein-sorting protein